MVRIKNRFIIVQLLENINTASYGKKLNPSNSNNSSTSSGNEVLAKDIQSSVRDKIQELFGDIGAGEFGEMTFVRFYDPQISNIVVLRTPRGAEKNVMFALSSISKIKARELTFRTVSLHGCSRTCIKSLRNLTAIIVNESTSSKLDSEDRRATARQTINALIAGSDF